MSQPFNSYIDELLREGKLHSSGSFSLDSKKALEKLSAFQLADPSWWVLKMVQAAVASGAARIDIQIDADSCIFVFEPEIRWTNKTVLEALDNPGAEKFPGLDHFKSALWSCSLHQGHLFRLELKDQKEAIVGMVGDTHFSPSNGGRTALCVSQRKAGEGFLVSGVKAAKRSGELQARLIERAYFCNIPLSLNGIALDREAFNCISASGIRQCLVETQALRLDIPTVPTPYPKGEIPGRQVAQFSPSAWPDPERPCTEKGTAYASLVYNVQGGLYNKLAETQDSIVWIQDGVIVDSQPIFQGPARCLSLVVYLSAKGLATDISGSKLVESPERSDRQEKVQLAIVNGLDLSRIKTRELKPTRENISVRQTYALSIVGSGGLAWWGMDFTAGVLLGGLAAFLFGIAAVPMGWDSWSSGVDKRIKADARLLEQRLQKLKPNAPT